MNQITVKFVDRPDEVFQTNSFDPVGGFVRIIEQLRGLTKTTCIPAAVIDRIIVEANT